MGDAGLYQISTSPDSEVVSNNKEKDQEEGGGCGVKGKSRVSNKDY